MEMRIYVANLAAYNAGFLVGEWIDLPLEKDELWSRIQKILDKWNDGCRPSEEWAIHDYEGFPFEVSEYSNVDKLNKIAETLNNLNEDEDVIKAVFDLLNRDEALEKLQNGEYRVYDDCDSMGDVAYQLYEESGRLAEIEKVISSSYIDWEVIGRDMEIEGTFKYIGNSRFVEIID
jgi:antirestriction protein